MQTGRRSSAWIRKQTGTRPETWPEIRISCRNAHRKATGTKTCHRSRRMDKQTDKRPQKARIGQIEPIRGRI